MKSRRAFSFSEPPSFLKSDGLLVRNPGGAVPDAKPDPSDGPPFNT
jgi:hypothetical protein